MLSPQCVVHQPQRLMFRRKSLFCFVLLKSAQPRRLPLKINDGCLPAGLPHHPHPPRGTLPPTVTACSRHYQPQLGAWLCLQKEHFPRVEGGDLWLCLCGLCAREHRYLLVANIFSCRYPRVTLSPIKQQVLQLRVTHRNAEALLFNLKTCDLGRSRALR